VNNAGIAGNFARIPDTTEAQFDAIMNVNVKGVWNCLRHELNIMIPQGKGSIINLSSVAGLKGAHSLGIYSASKHAVIGFTKSAALEYIKKGIRVNAVCPVFTRTAMVQNFFDAVPHMTDAVVNASPARRLGEPEEVAQAALWLASDASSFTNGLALTVDGGFTIQ
jgi:NAD(P)-dependent dehydrogenase (short-subunit alcohol dehydrogenase family)